MNQLIKKIKEYNKLCDKLEQLNDKAFELEKEIRYLESQGEKDD